MDANLKDLIEMATASGSISPEHEKLIIDKGSSLGISEVEIRLYIDAALRKNAVSVTTNKPITGSVQTNEYININEFGLGEWIMSVGIIIIAISGFFTWIKASVHSGGFGSSFGGSASGGGGLFYSIPLAISAFVFLYKKSLEKYRLYEGIGIMAIALALFFSYSSKSSYGGGGISASASTKAGAGVTIMFFGGLIYTIGALLYNKNVNNYSYLLKYFRHPLAKIILLGFLILCPVLTKFDLHGRIFELIIAGAIFAGIPFVISRKSGYKKFYSIAITTISVWVLALFIPNYSQNSILENLSDSFRSVVPWYFIIALLLGGVGLFSDYQEANKKSFPLGEKLNSLFNYKYLFGFFLLLFLGLFSFTAVTKHKITSDEQNAFIEKNGKAKGEWYFLGEDTSSIYELSFNFNIINTTNTGDIEFTNTARLYNSSISLDDINMQELRDNKKYDYEIVYPINFNKGLKIDSIQEDKLIGSFILRGKQMVFYAFRDRQYINSLIEEKNNRILAEEAPVLPDSSIFNTDGMYVEEEENNSKLFKIQDPDGFTNLRETPGGTIIRKVYDADRFTVQEALGEYFRVLLNDGTEGYIHRSRVIQAE